MASSAFEVMPGDMILGGWHAWGGKNKFTLLMLYREGEGWIGRLCQRKGREIVNRYDVQYNNPLEDSVVVEELATGVFEDFLRDGLATRLAHIECVTYDTDKAIRQLGLLATYDPELVP